MSVNVFRQVANQGILAVGMTMILSWPDRPERRFPWGGLFAAVLNALFLKSGMPIPAALLAISASAASGGF
jgi:ribose/xylose/arabinose/galactoside ABC-type transport system permease subunit